MEPEKFSDYDSLMKAGNFVQAQLLMNDGGWSLGMFAGNINIALLRKGEIVDRTHLQFSWPSGTGNENPQSLEQQQ
jgi:hypothetical protein